MSTLVLQTITTNIDTRLSTRKIRRRGPLKAHNIFIQVNYQSLPGLRSIRETFTRQCVVPSNFLYIHFPV